MSLLDAGYKPMGAGGPDEDVQVMVRRIARELGVDEETAYQLIKHESNFNPQAVSPKGAMGLSQLMPGTAMEMGLTEPDFYNPEKNVRAGLGYFKRQLDAFGGDREMALAAYNAGPGNVRKYGGIPPFSETQKYVQSITAAAPAIAQSMPAGGGLLAAGYTPIGNKVRVPSDHPLVGSPEHVRLMMEGGALPAMKDEPAAGEVPADAVVHTDPDESRAALKAEYPVKVVRHVDGDSMFVRFLHTDTVQEIRLDDINAPEYRTESGKAAAERVMALAPIGSTMILETNAERGKYGRTLGKLYARELGMQVDISTPEDLDPDRDPGHLKGFGAGVGRMGADIVGFVGGVGHAAGRMMPGGKGPLEAFGETFEAVENTAFSQRMTELRDEYLAAAEGEKWIPVPFTDEGDGPTLISVNELFRVGTYYGGEFLDLFWAGGKKAMTKLFTIANKYNKARMAGMGAEEAGEKLLRVSKEVADIVDERATGRELAGKYAEVMEPAEEGTTALGRISGVLWRVVDHFSEKEAALSNLDTTLNRYVQRHRSSARIGQGPIANQTFYFDEVAGETKRLGESFRDIWAGVNQDEMLDADLYMTFERLVKDIGADPKLMDELGVTAEVLADGKRIMAGIERSYGNKWGIMRDRMNRHYDWRRNAILRPLKELGVIDEKTYENLVNKFEHYSPFFRKATDPILEAIEKAGGESALDDIITLEGKIGTNIRGIEHARMTPGGEPLKKLKHGLREDMKVGSGLKSDLIRSQSIHRWIEAQRVRNQLGRVIEADPERFLKDVARVSGDHAKKLKGYKNTFTTYKNGVKQTYYVKDKRLIQALDSLSSAQMGVFQSVLSNPFAKPLIGASSLFRKGVVLGLEFMFRNPVRDQFSAGLFTKFGYNPFLSFFSGLFHTISRDEVWRRFHESGGAMSVFESLDVPTIDYALRDMQGVGITFSERLKQISHAGGAPRRGASGQYTSAGRSVVNSFKNFWAETGKKRIGAKAATLPIHGLQRISEILEEATRVGAFNKAMKRAKKGVGYTPFVALDHALGGLPGLAEGIFTFGRNWRGGKFAKRYKEARAARSELDWMDEAREITLDFSRRGHFGELMNGMIPFANAELQDVSRFYRAMRDQPLTTLTRGFTFLTLPAVVNWMMNHDNPDYRMLSESERSLFFHFLPMSDKYKKFFRIPRPVGSPQVFMGWGVEKMLDWMAENDHPAVKKLSESLWPGRAPTGDTDAFMEWANTLAVTGPLKYLHSPVNTMPQAISPLIQMWANKDSFFGGNVIPRYLSDTGERLPQDTHVETTNQIMSPVAQMIRAFGSLSKFPWAESMNPMQAEFLFRKYTGSVGGMALEGITRAAEIAEVPGLEDRAGMPRDLSTMPGFKGFYSKTPWGPSSDPVEDFYRLYSESRQAYNSLQDDMARSDLTGMKKTASEHPEWAKYELMNEAAKDMTDMNRFRKQIATNRGMDDVKRRDILLYIDQYSSQFAAMAVMVYRQLEKDPLGTAGLDDGP
jgi:hypothetical protein